MNFFFFNLLDTFNLKENQCTSMSNYPLGSAIYEIHERFLKFLTYFKLSFQVFIIFN